MTQQAEPEELTLHQVAEELGVHYMTAYRYVRIGVLPARKEGRSWRVLRSDLEAMAASPEPSRQPGTTPWSERLINRMIAGDEPGSWSVIEAALSGGASSHEVLLDVVAPAMRLVGARWEDGTIGVDEEHIASAICTRLLGRLGGRFTRRGISKGTVVLGTTEHELHGLPTAILAGVLRSEGYDVQDLGPLLPPASFARAAGRADRLVAVGISATLAGQDANLEETVQAVRARTDAPILVGGPAVTSDEHARSVGADGRASDAASMVDLLENARQG